MNQIRTLVAATMMATLPLAALAEQSSSPQDAKVYFISPKNGDTVSNPVKVTFGLTGMGIAPAGTNIENTGHHHLIIDAPTSAADQPIPADDNHKHFGKGQTETTIELSPGEHTLQLVLGDWLHKQHDKPVVSETITITVE